MNQFSYGDRVVGNAIQEATGWIDAGEGIKAVNSGITALKRVAEQLAKADFSTMKPDVAARTAAYLAKMIDEIARLIEFAQGKADSRPDVRPLRDLLALLTDDQFKVFCQWIGYEEKGTSLLS